MTGQGALFEPVTHGGRTLGYAEPGAHARLLARRSDPSSSLEAARDVLASGAVTTHGEAIEQALGAHPWATSLELVCSEGTWLRKCGVDRTELSRRLSGLLDGGRIVRMLPPSEGAPDRNRSLLSCRSHFKAAPRQLTRWALRRDEARAAEFLTEPTENPVIDRGGNAAGG